MSNTLAIAMVTETLKKVLLSAINAAPPDLRGEGSIEVRSGRPTPDGRELPTNGINVFLYQVTPCAALRNADLPTRRPDGTIAERPALALELHYLLSFHGADKTLQPQKLMGIALQTLHSRPFLGRAAVEQTIDFWKQDKELKFLVSSDLARAVESVRLTPATRNLEEQSKLWSVFFQTPYFLSCAYDASPVIIEATELGRPAPPVLVRSVAVTSGLAPVIERVGLDGRSSGPITAGQTVRVEGRGFASETVAVVMGGVRVAPRVISDELLSFDVPASVRPGVQGVVVTRGVGLGGAGFESGVAPVVVHAKLAAARASNVKKIGSGPSARVDATLTVDVDLPVEKKQRVVMTLETRPPAETLRLAFEAAPRLEASRSISLELRALPLARYAVSEVRVDGALSVGPSTPFEVDLS